MLRDRFGSTTYNTNKIASARFGLEKELPPVDLITNQGAGKLSKQADRLILTLAIFLNAVVLWSVWFEIPLHSDALFYDALINSVKESPDSYWNWRLTPAAAYFPDLLIYYVVSFAVESVHARLFFLNVAQWLMLFSGCYLLIRTVYNRRSIRFLAFYLFFVALFTLAVTSSNQFWIFHFHNNGHSSSLILPLFILYVAIFSVAKKTRKTLIAVLLLLNLLAATSDKLTILTFSIPLALTLLFSVQSKHLHLRTLFRSFESKVAAALITTGAAGLILSTVLVRNNAAGIKTDLSIKGVMFSLDMLRSNLMNLINSPKIHEQILTWITVISLLNLFVQTIRITRRQILHSTKTESLHKNNSDARSRDFIYIFATLSLLVTFVGGALSGGFQDPNAFRYLNLGLSLSICLASLEMVKVIYITDLTKSIISFFLLAAIIVIGANVGHQNLQKIGTNQFANPRGGVPLPMNVARCLDKIETSGEKLQRGIATYWHARFVSNVSTNHFKISQVDENGSPFYWMNSLDDYLGTDGTTINFAIVLSEKAVPWSFSAKTLKGLKTPSPSAVYRCSSEEDVWVWRSNEFDKFITTHWSFIIRDQKWKQN
jgi:hypothetical protein